MANVKITDLTAYTNPDSTDVLPIVDVGADVTKKVSIQDLLENAGSGTAAAPGIAFDGDPNTGIYSPGADQLALSTGGTGRLFVDASGNVGIGTTSPQYKFQVSQSASAVCFGESSSVATIIGTSAAGTASQELSLRGFPLTFTGNGGGGSEAARIDSSGRLLVGTASYPQNIAAAFKGNGGSATGSGNIALLRQYSAISGNNLNASIAQIRFGDDNQNGDGAQITADIDGTNWSTTSKPTRLVFSTTADGASSPTEQLRITSDRYVRLASGTGGIQFGGDTAAANALDDYEEGTWTATLTDGTATHNGDGRYTKIGNLVFVSLRLNNAGSGFSGSVYITGLPFTAAGQPNSALATNINYTSTATTWCARIEDLTTTINIYRVGAAFQDNVQLASTDINSFTDFDISGCYQV